MTPQFEMMGAIKSQSAAACVAVAVGTVLVLVVLLGWDGRLMPGITGASFLLLRSMMSIKHLAFCCIADCPMLRQRLPAALFN